MTPTGTGKVSDRNRSSLREGEAKDGRDTMEHNDDWATWWMRWMTRRDEGDEDCEVDTGLWLKIEINGMEGR